MQQIRGRRRARRQRPVHGRKAGSGRTVMKGVGGNLGKINVAIIGVGNCASSLVQGVHFYRDANEKASIPGLMHVNLGGYHISDINFVAAIDIDVNKVGKDLSEAIYSPPNNTYRFADVPSLGIRVSR